MKKQIIALTIAVLLSTSTVHSFTTRSIQICNEDGTTEFEVVLDGMVDWLLSKKITIEEMAEFFPQNIIDELVEIRHEKMKEQYLLGDQKAAYIEQWNLGFSIDQLLSEDKLSVDIQHVRRTIGRNVLKVQVFHIENQHIQSIEGLANIPGIANPAFVSFKNNGIRSISFESLKELNDMRRYPVVIDFSGNPLSITVDVLEKLDSLKFISLQM